jgi:F420-0:gamma-glutamyl ligase-like protein
MPMGLFVALVYVIGFIAGRLSGRRAVSTPHQDQPEKLV